MVMAISYVCVKKPRNIPANAVWTMNYQQIVTLNAHGSREKEIVVDPTS